MVVPARVDGRRLTAATPIRALLLVVALLVGLVPAAAASTDGGGSSARLAELERRADALEQRAEDARLRAEQADTDVAEAELELGENEQLLGDVARRAYVHGRSTVDPLVIAIATANQGPDQLAERLHYLERTIGAQVGALESASALTERLAALRGQALTYQRLATQRLRDAEAATSTVAFTHGEVLALTDAASRTLSEREQQLATVAEERQRVVDEAETLTSTARDEEEAARVAAAAEAAAPSGEETVHAAPRAPAPSAGSGGGLVTVRGITVAASLGPALEALLAAAAADGFVLGGSGYRSPAVTERLRVANGCPDIYDSPASSCRIPTARPGTSEHEKGLAVDFTYQGQTICFPRSSSNCSGNAAFDWLRSNAGSYGLRNLPSEAWHWSTTGR